MNKLGQKGIHSRKKAAAEEEVSHPENGRKTVANRFSGL